MQVFRGTSVAPGYGRGLAVPYRRIDAIFTAAAATTARDPSAELHRFEVAQEAARRELTALAHTLRQRFGIDESHIFHAQVLMLQDETFTGLVRNAITGGASAERAIVDAVGHIEQLFQQQSNPYLRERSMDIRDVGVRVLTHLIGKDAHPFARIPQDAVIVADELLPSDTIFLDRTRVRAVVTTHGAENSHASILARALGIPAVTNVPGLIDACRQGDEIAVNGETGEVFVRIHGTVEEEYTRQARSY